MPYNKITVLLVDDHPFVLEGIRSCLSFYGRLEIVGEAANGRQAIEKAKTLGPSVIVMDISMPIMNGLEATRHLRRCLPEAKVLILSLHDQREFAAEIMESGARGYVSKNTSPAELMSAIQTVHDGGTFFPEAMKEALLENLAGAGAAELSLREREVVALVAEGFSNKQAAGLLGVSLRTVEKHRERIMGKLDLHSMVELTKYAISHQLVQVQ